VQFSRSFEVLDLFDGVWMLIMALVVLDAREDDLEEGGGGVIGILFRTKSVLICLFHFSRACDATFDVGVVIVNRMAHVTDKLFTFKPCEGRIDRYNDDVEGFGVTLVIGCRFVDDSKPLCELVGLVTEEFAHLELKFEYPHE
jgi:hypothetical protein